jgi:hypothetical protein
MVKIFGVLVGVVVDTKNSLMGMLEQNAGESQEVDFPG